MDQIKIVQEAVSNAMLLLISDGSGEHEKDVLRSTFEDYAAECQKNIDDCDMAIQECNEKMEAIGPNKLTEEVEINNQKEQIISIRDEIKCKLAELAEVKEQLLTFF